MNSPSSHSVSSEYVDSSDMASPLLIMRAELFECGDERIRRLGKNRKSSLVKPCKKALIPLS